MLSRWNFCRAITFGLHRPCTLYPVCVAKNKITRLCHRSSQRPCHGHDRVSENIRLLRMNSFSQQTLPPSPTLPPTLPPTPPPTPPENEESQNIFKRFKNMAKKYWYILLPVHLVTSTIWFGSFYFIASSGVDVPALLESLRFPEWIINKVKNGNSWTSYLLIAYGLYKIVTPLRYMVTIGGTTMVKRYLQRKGYGNSSP